MQHYCAKGINMRKKRKALRPFALDYAILLGGALVMGAVLAGFAMATDKAQALFFTAFAREKLLPLVLTPTAFAVSVWLMLRYFPAASGSGVPQALAAQQLTDKKSHAYLLGPRVIVGKMLLVVLVLLCGASLGREGPCVQLGAGIMLLFSRYARLPDRRLFITAGGAAGFAAAFNAPLAGIAFLVEEMARGMRYKERLTILSIILLAAIGATSVMGDYDYFGHVKSGLTLTGYWWPIVVIGLICGCVGAVFNLMITKGRKHVGKMLNGFDKKQPIAFAAGCGFLVAALGIATGGVSFGSGYEIGHGLLHGTAEPSIWHPFAKMAATILSVISGVPGGTIAPALSIGATVGGASSHLFPGTTVSAIVLLAIAGYFAAFTQSPITAAVIVLEITGKATTALPLLVVALIAACVSRTIFPHSIFDLMAETVIADLKKKKEDISHYDA